MHKIIKVKNIEIANNKPFVLIAGPCQMESRDHAIESAGSIKEICDSLNIQLIYKSSFDKANRTSIAGKRGLGLKKCLPIFEEIKNLYNIPVLTDIHEASQCNEVASVVDILQIPAFLCRQTDLLIAAAKTNAVINVKKGQFLAPWDMNNVIQKLTDSNNDKIILTDRGTCFGYNNLVSDMRGLKIMADTGYPVIMDATHSTQQPGGMGQSSGGQREFAPVIARSAIAVGIAGIFMEVHEDPDNAPSDGPCMIKLHELKSILSLIKKIDNVIKTN